LIDLTNSGRAKDGLGAAELIVHLDCTRSKLECFRLGYRTTTLARLIPERNREACLS
jgi:hypothetical protein